MEASEQPQIVEAFLLVEQPRQRLGYWTKALAALDTPDAPPVYSIIAYYDPTSDQALLDVQYEAASANMKFVVEVALLAEVGMVQPAELSEGERVRFLAERLPRCTIRVTSQRSPAAALIEVVRRIKDIRQSKLVTQPPPIPQAALARSVNPRGDTDDPVMLVQAKGTRDNLERLPDELGDGPEAPPPPRRESAQEILKRDDRHRTVPMPFELSQKLIGESSQLMDLRQLKPPPRTEVTPPPVMRTERASMPQLPLPAPAPTEPNPIVRPDAKIADAPTNVREKTPQPSSRRNEKATVREKTPPPSRTIDPAQRLLTDVDPLPPTPPTPRMPSTRMPSPRLRHEGHADPYLPPSPGAP
ncbi:MAG TPA: hypothetical protein VIV40_00200, partial [Kofleriaceae bacterium]